MLRETAEFLLGGANPRFSCRLNCVPEGTCGQGDAGEAESMQKNWESEAIEALRETLGQLSVIKVKDISVDRHGHRGDRTILAQIEIYRHTHLLVCKVISTCDAQQMKRAAHELQLAQKERGLVVTPILISPSMSEEAQTLCRERNIGFLDLEGNARLYLDEVFIVKRSFDRKKIPPRAEPMPPSETARFAHVA